MTTTQEDKHKEEHDMSGFPFNKITHFNSVDVLRSLHTKLHQQAHTSFLRVYLGFYILMFWV
jgi:hypothetical protein